MTLLADPARSAKVEFARRTAGAALIDAVRPGDHVVMTRIDRGFRNVADFLQWFDNWIRKDIYLHVIRMGADSIDPRTPVGRLVFRILAVLAEWERELLSERIREAHAAFRERGVRMTNRTPVGFKAERLPGGKGQGFRFVPDVEERKFLSTLVDLHHQGLNYDQISHYLRERGIRSPRSRPGTYRLQSTAVRRYIEIEMKLRESEGRT